MLLNKILLCFVQPLNQKVYRSHEFFDGEFLKGAMYCMLEEMTKLRMTSCLKARENLDKIQRLRTILYLSSSPNSNICSTSINV